jgi:hypothetical protein
VPLQNRVDPFGQIHAVSERGMFTGNRGIIHDPASRTLLKRRWTTKAWIVCQLHFKDHVRVPMSRNSWTELFFLDEVTALAAGHRPCFFCQRRRAADFAYCFRNASNADFVSAKEVDIRLHAERLAAGGRSIALSRFRLGELPDGTMICCGAMPHALRYGQAIPWSFAGYGEPRALGELGDDLRLLTPRSTVAALRAGYRALWHRSAGA